MGNRNIKCKWSDSGECTFNDENKCNGTLNEMWECAYCSNYEYWGMLMRDEKENKKRKENL